MTFFSHFAHCIIRPSSDVPDLFGHRNGSTWEIIFKVWLLISQVESFLCPDKQGTPEDGRRIQQLKRSEKNNKDEDNSPKTLTDKNHQASSQKFRQLVSFVVFQIYVIIIYVKYKELRRQPSAYVETSFYPLVIITLSHKQVWLSVYFRSYFITFARSSRLHPVSTQSWCMFNQHWCVHA